MSKLYLRQPGQRLLRRIVDHGSNRNRSFTIVRERWMMEAGALPKQITDAPSVSGKGMTGASVRIEDHVANYEWRFETTDSPGNGWSGFPASASQIVTFEGSLNKTPITMHRDFGKWIGYRSPDGKKFGTVIGGEVVWEIEDPRQGIGPRRGLSAAGAVVQDMNPLYGVKDFYDASALHIVEEAMLKSELRTVLTNIGSIMTPPKMKGDEQSANRNWLYVGADATQVGNKFWVRRTWMMSGFGKWERAIYDPNFFS